MIKGGEFRNRSLKKGCVSAFFVLFKGGDVYFLSASIFCVCILSGGENRIFFLFDLFAFYFRFVNL